MTTADVTPLRRERDGWALIENDPPQPRRRVLMLPGLFCSAAFFTDVLADEALTAAGVTALAAEPPGFAGSPRPTASTSRSHATRSWSSGSPRPSRST